MRQGRKRGALRTEAGKRFIFFKTGPGRACGYTRPSPPHACFRLHYVHAPPRIAPLAVTAHTVTTALGAGLEAQRVALAQGRGGLRRNDFGDAALDCWIGRVEGLEQAPLPAALARWESRNHRLAWLALHQDGFIEAAAAAVQRHGATRVAAIIGT